jgi:heterodisulfide reductase subunit B
MTYLYYPGCSLEGSAREYDQSCRSLFQALGCDLTEVEGWTCCGASAAEATSHLLSLALPARILALAENQTGTDDLLVPCSACYLNLKKVELQIRSDRDLLITLNEILAEEGLALAGRTRVRHLLDVLACDVGAEAIGARVRRRLQGLEIAPYYGCQCLRPYPVFDDPEQPRCMDNLIRAAGARVHAWEKGGRCCGASQMSTKPEVALERVVDILQAARGADAIATVCPMCQMNLEAYQGRASRQAGEDLTISIVYLPQLLGAAMGLGTADLGLGLNLALDNDFRAKVAAPVSAPAAAGP